MMKELQSDSKRLISQGLKSRVKGLSGYQLSILKPSEKLYEKIPGTGARSSALKHTLTRQTYQTNASGHLALTYIPNAVQDSGATTSAFLVTTNASLYDPSTAAATVAINVVDCRPLYQLNSGTARQVRLVSQSIKVYSLSTALNRKGTIYGCAYHTVAAGEAAYGAYTVPMPTVPTISNQSLLKRAAVNNGEGVLVCYIPSDDDDLQFLAPNTQAVTRHSGGDDVYISTIICQGLEASSFIQVEIDLNFETVPIAESTLAGFETPGSFREVIPTLEIQHLRAYHPQDLVRIVDAYDGGDGLILKSDKPLKVNPSGPPIGSNIAVFEPDRFVNMGSKIGGSSKMMAPFKFAEFQNSVKEVAKEIIKSLPGLSGATAKALVNKKRALRGVPKYKKLRQVNIRK